MNETETRPWTLAGPWYRWDDPYDPAAGRASRPVFQKYDTPQFVNEFLKEPQHSLKFTATDQVYDVVSKPAPASGERSPTLSRFDRSATGTRKLFLHVHRRFYLVTCELHCDAPGFPNEDAKKACEAGFVVRRRRVVYPYLLPDALRPILTEIAAVREPLLRLDAATPHAVRKKLTGPAASRYQERYETLLAEATRLGVALKLEGWLPDEKFSNVGTWAEVVDEAPSTVTKETVFPLYPLVPDRREKKHSGRGRAIYFGVVPVGGAEADANGVPRFDEVSLYEIRCFVRRHRPQCPKTGKRNDCRGELVWSQRTESYRLASHFDLDGTSQQPVTIQMPDLPALEAQAANLAPGEGCPVRMVWPEGSALDFTVDNNGKPQSKGPPGKAICSFSIPLITIVASFVLQLFLPIVVFVFQLYYLLTLKFCIPPSVSLDGGLAADLNARLPEFDVDASLQVELDAQLDIDLKTYSGEFAAGAKADLQSKYTPNALAGFVKHVSADFSPEAKGKSGVVPADLPVLTAGAEYETFHEVRTNE